MRQWVGYELFPFKKMLPFCLFVLFAFTPEITSAADIKNIYDEMMQYNFLYYAVPGSRNK